MIGRNGVEAGGCVFCQNINDTETRMEQEWRGERRGSCLREASIRLFVF